MGLVSLAILLGFIAGSLASAEQLPREQMPPPPPSLGGSGLPGGMVPGADPFQMLMNSHELQAELQLTEIQIRHLSRNDASFRTKLREMSFSNPNALQEQIAEDQNKIARVLTPAQLGRFKEIMLQIGAPCSIVMRDAGDYKKLELSPSQTGEIEGLCQSMRDRLRVLADNANHDHPNDRCAARNAVMEAERNLKNQLKQEANRILKDSQRKAYIAMQGKPFDLDHLPPPACEQ